MVKKYLTDPKLKTLKQKFSNLNDITGYALNCKLGKEITISQKQNMVNDFASQIKKAFYVNGSIYVYTKSNMLLKYDPKTGQTTTVAGALGDDLLIDEVILNGKKETLMITRYNSFVGVNEFYMPYGKYLTVYRGRCFTAINNTVSFGAPFDFADYSFEQLSGTFNTDERDGEITGLCVLGEVLYVFCQRAIYKLVSNDATIFSLIKLCATVGEICHGSAKCVGGKILFTSGKRIFAFDGSNASVIDETIQDLGLEIVEGFNVCGEKYSINVNIDGKSAQYVFDSIDKSVQIIYSVSNMTLDNGYAIDADGKLYKTLIDEGQLIGEVFWQSKPIYFSSPYKKQLLEVSCYSLGQTRLKISGDFGEKSFELKEGVNVIRLNSESITFSLKFTGDHAFALSNLCAKFRIIGE